MRNPRFFNVPRSQTESQRKSFFPYALDAWNQLDADIRNLTSVSLFNNRLNQDLERPPTHFTIGSRKLNIIYCQLRNEVSDLKHHLFLSHLSESSQCDCGKGIEDNFHYFWVCPNYKLQRMQLSLDLIDYADILDMNTLLGNNKVLSPKDNKGIGLYR